MPYIRVLNDRSPESQEVFLEDEVVRAGRSSSNQLCLEDGAASREHFELRLIDDAYSIRDLGSRNGTQVNGEALDGERRLNDGDTITVGRTHLYYGEGLPDETPIDLRRDSATVMFEAEQLSSSYLAEAEDRADERSRKDLVVLNELSRDLLSISTEEDLLDLIVQRLRDVFKTDRCAVIFRRGEDDIDVKALAGPPGQDTLDVRISTTAARSVLEDRMALHITDVANDDRYSAQQSILDASITSILCAPLWHQNTVFGLVYLDSTGRPGTLDKERLALLSAVTNQAAIKIDNLRLVDETISKARMERELALAAEIQATMLPQEPFSHPGFVSLGFNEPCYEVGGDYFDFMPLADGGFSVTVADVSGKGASAAMLMASCKSMLTAQIDASVPLVERVRKLNLFVTDNSTANKFITFFQAEIDSRPGKLRYANAGHNPPIIVAPNGATELLPATGPVLGLLDLPYCISEVDFPPGATLVAYSDGVTEATNADDEEYEDDRLLKVVSACSGMEPEAMRDAILEDVETFTGGAAQQDDVTLVIVKAQG